MDAQTQSIETPTVAAMENVNRPMTAETAAEFLGFSKGYLYKLVSANKISYYRPGGKILYFLQEDLEKYAYRNRVASRYEVREKAEALLNGTR
jgi:excisionase family DNA binding protein